MMAISVLAGAAAAAALGGDFGKDVQLAPFVVKGSPLTISIHARTKSDRRYAEKFADEVVEVAHETMADSTGKGLIIVGAKGEPHPILVFRRFLELAQAGQLDPQVAEAAGEVEEMLKKAQRKIKVDEGSSKETGITFDTFMPALPVPLEGTASVLYQLAWAEGFEAARVEQMLRTLKPADLRRDELGRFDWVFYLPPHSATSVVLHDMLNKAMKAEKMGVVKRAAVRSAVFAAGPFIRKAAEAMRKGMLFAAILDAQSDYNEGDIDALTRVYFREMMPDLKPGSIGEKRRLLAALEQQKIANAEYAKDPFVKPERLANFEPAAFAAFEGEYTSEPPETTHRFLREGVSFQWKFKDGKPREFFPAGDRLLVNAEGTQTIEFQVDEAGTVTGVEERWVRRRNVIPRKA